MSEIVLVLLFLLIGGLTGILAGMLGIGGGAVFVPVLYLLLPFTNIDMSQISFIVIDTSLFAASLTSLSSSSNHFIAKNVDKRRALYFGAGSVIASLLSTFVVVRMNPFFLKWIFAAVFSVIAVKMLLDNNSKAKIKVKSLNDSYLIFFGLIAGTIAAFAGVGGGIIFVPVLMYFSGLEIKKAVGTSSVIVAFTTITATLSYLLQTPHGTLAAGQIGYVYLLAAISLGIGAVIGAVFGVKIVLKSSSKIIKRVFSILIILVVIKILL